MSKFNNYKHRRALERELKKYNFERADLFNILKQIVESMKEIEFANEYYDCAVGLEDSFDEDLLIYRTAYAALCMKKAVSQGYAEAIELILRQNGIRCCILLSAIKHDNFDAIVHTIIAVPFENKYVIMDPMRKYACWDEMEYDKVKEKAEYFFEFKGHEKIGNDGAGMRLSELYGKAWKLAKEELVYL